MLEIDPANSWNILHVILLSRLHIKPKSKENKKPSSEGENGVAATRKRRRSEREEDEETAKGEDDRDGVNKENETAPASNKKQKLAVNGTPPKSSPVRFRLG